MRIHHLKTTRQYSESACKVNRLNGGGAVLNGTEDPGEAITIDSARSAYVPAVRSAGPSAGPDAYDTARARLDAAGD